MSNPLSKPDDSNSSGAVEMAETQATAVNPIIPSAEKTVDKLKEITDRLEQGVKELFDSEKYKAYLSTMSKFHRYSLNNTILIAIQMPSASYVAGYNAWQDNFKRQVRKGEKGIRIFAPAPYKKQQEMEKIDPRTQKPVIGQDGKPVTETMEITIPSFKVAVVFDVSQTEGEALPTLGVEWLTGDVDRYKDFFAALEQVSPVPIAFEKIEGGAHGYYHLAEKRIALLEGMSELQTLKTAIHEIAHARLHDIDLNAPKGEQNRVDRQTREVEAESVAFTICQHYGLDTSDFSFAYVAGWSSGKEVPELKASLETIRSAAGALITEMDNRLAELQKVWEQEQIQAALTALERRGDTYAIYQLKQDDSTREYRYESLESMMKAGFAIDSANYELVYSAPITDDTANLDKIFEKFNRNLPEDFMGHSLSVSDVVIVKRGDKETAHYVDSYGFAVIPEFLQPTQEKQLHSMPEQQVQDASEAFLHISSEPTASHTSSTFDLQQTADYLHRLYGGMPSASLSKGAEATVYGETIKQLENLFHKIPESQPMLLAHIAHVLDSTDLPMLKERMAIIHNEFVQHYTQQPTVGELEAKVNAGESIPLIDLTRALKAEKESPTLARGTEAKRSVREQLTEARKEVQIAESRPQATRQREKEVTR